MDAAQKAVHLFENGLNCSQAILTAFGEPHGIDSESAKKLGRPWGGGVGRMGRICGAVTGAIMVLGLAQSGWQDEAEARNDLFQLSRNWLDVLNNGTGPLFAKIFWERISARKRGSAKLKRRCS